MYFHEKEKKIGEEDRILLFPMYSFTNIQFDFHHRFGEEVKGSTEKSINSPIHVYLLIIHNSMIYTYLSVCLLQL